jgi:hypothetical protein
MGDKYTISARGDLSATKNFLQKLMNFKAGPELVNVANDLKNKIADRTPYDTGRTREGYFVETDAKSATINNLNVDEAGTAVPILIHYGHGTGTGGYVPTVPIYDPSMISDNDISGILKGGYK